MTTVQLDKTAAFDLLRQTGADALHKTLVAAGAKPIDAQIRQDLDQLLAEAVKGIELAGGTVKETIGLVRLVGYLHELAFVAGLLPALGVRFTTYLTPSGNTELRFRVAGAKPAEPEDASPAKTTAADIARQGVGL